MKLAKKLIDLHETVDLRKSKEFKKNLKIVDDFAKAVEGIRLDVDGIKLFLKEFHTGLMRSEEAALNRPDDTFTIEYEVEKDSTAGDNNDSDVNDIYFIRAVNDDKKRKGRITIDVPTVIAEGPDHTKVIIQTRSSRNSGKQYFKKVESLLKKLSIN